MGMTDKQFEAYLKKQLRLLQQIEIEIKAGGGESRTLQTEIKDLEEYLSRP